MPIYFTLAGRNALGDRADGGFTQTAQVGQNSPTSRSLIDFKISTSNN
jgi:hypothetical protein